MTDAKYLIGIDLGTTHCAVTYSKVSTDQTKKEKVESFPILQIIEPGVTDKSDLLPSFIFMPNQSTVKAEDMALPWDQEASVVVGAYAKEHASKSPNRVVSSAKSWLCQEHIDKRSGILPVNAIDDIEPFSPLQAIIYYLEHIRNAWDWQFSGAPLFQQKVTLTIPASFDPAARELVAEAARLSDMNQLTLLEEPQAAFYSWLDQMGDSWRDQVSIGDVILVVDVGGGTTDFTLISVEENEGDLSLKRVAVGEHILVGGDNMDWLLAHLVNSKFTEKNKKLESWQIQSLTHSCRAAKESLLSDSSLDEVSVVIPGRSSKLIGRSIKEKITQSDVAKTILDGFFPNVDIHDKPKTRQRGGVSRINLNYAQDAGITRHLAAFLTKQKAAVSDNEQEDFIKPNKVLFNGGVFKSSMLRQRILSVLNRWLMQVNHKPAVELSGAEYDLGVARGACVFGQVQDGNAIRIRGGSAQSYYIGLESPMPTIPGFEPPIEALCIAPFGMETGSNVTVSEQNFGLVVGETVNFRFFGSNVRREDQVGTILTNFSDEELEELHQLEINLESEKYNKGDVVPVYLSASQTEVGTLVLNANAQNSSDSWKIEFNMRHD
ncbi:Hsp70 family protein [Thiotrichales bacterium 19S9-12]|nr:Hsp70 family protein [Thiotrichales bacterium 19S9-11]MCF6811030.1 Hsp70 family protein [Thiotrichales bacterium 19S9-12]